MLTQEEALAELLRGMLGDKAPASQLKPSLSTNSGARSRERLLLRHYLSLSLRLSLFAYG